MYCRFYDLPQHDDCAFVFQAQRREPNTERYSAFYADDKNKSRSFPVRDSIEGALNDLKDRSMDGQVMRFVKTEQVPPTITAGCAARLWVDTSATDGDINHFTKEEHESYGRLVSELYQGPFSLSHCHQIIAELKDKVPYLGVIKLGAAYNVAQVIQFPATDFVFIDEGRLHIRASRASLEQMIEEWHEGGTDVTLHDFLDMPFEAFSQYATSPGKCVFMGDSVEG
jgi:hypothetical protein